MQRSQINPALIKNLIDSDIHNANELLQLLNKEKSALETRDSDLLKAILPEKKQVLSNLDKNAQTRSSILKQLGKPDSADNWKTLIESIKLTTSWKDLEQCLKQCQELNQVNERVISRSQQTVGRLLEIFRGQLGQPSVYNEKGNTRGRGLGLSRTITTA